MRTMLQLMNRLSIGIAGGTVIAMLSGCAVPSNARMELGATPATELLLPVAGNEPLTLDALPENSTAEVAIDRSSWQGARVAVPVDGVHHRPLYAKPYGLTTGNHRQRAEWPELENVLDVTPQTPREGLSEIVLAPIGAARDAIFMPFQMAFQKRHRPARIVAGPAVPYERDRLNSAAMPMPSSTKSEGSEQ